MPFFWDFQLAVTGMILAVIFLVLCWFSCSLSCFFFFFFFFLVGIPTFVEAVDVCESLLGFPCCSYVFSFGNLGDLVFGFPYWWTWWTWWTWSWREVKKSMQICSFLFRLWNFQVLTENQWDGLILNWYDYSSWRESRSKLQEFFIRTLNR